MIFMFKKLERGKKEEKCTGGTKVLISSKVFEAYLHPSSHFIDTHSPNMFNMVLLDNDNNFFQIFKLS